MKLSVIMSFFNNEYSIEKSVRSILDQTYHDFEFLILDDGSTDKSFEIVSSIVDKRLIVFRNDLNMGLPYSLNKLLKLTDSNLIARMDADDISLNNRLETQIDFLNSNKSISVLGTSFIKIQNGKHKKVRVPINNENIRARMLFSNSIFHPTVMFRKNVVIDSGGYSTSYRRSQDYELWLRLMRDNSVKFSNISSPLLHYNQNFKNLELLKEGDINRDFIKIYFYTNVLKLNINVSSQSRLSSVALILCKSVRLKLINPSSSIIEFIYQFSRKLITDFFVFLIPINKVI